jgi:hypothetical protein
MFKLPIEYIDHHTVDSSLIKELELTVTEDTSGISVYHKLFSPTNDVSKHISAEFAKYYTTNKLFLSESANFHKQFTQSVQNYDSFASHWTKLTKNEEFNLTYQYFKHAQLVPFNTSSKFMFMISLYFITSPVLYIASPMIMLLLPFLFISKLGIQLTWSEYKIQFFKILKNHAIGGLFLGFNEATDKQRLSMLGSAAMFIIQLYCTGYSFYSFYKTISEIHDIMDSTTSYIKTKIIEMSYVLDKIQNLSTYKGFAEAVKHNQTILINYYNKISNIKSLSYSWSEVMNIGCLRAYFYELYSNKELKEAIEYSIGFSGYIESISTLQKKLASRKINACSFADKTTFTKAYYPVKSVTNSYSLENRVITGPNASGKTTLIKQTMINVLLSQQLGCGFYKRATICPYEVLCCYVNIPDTSGRDSLFQAEARRCKSVLESVDTNKRVFCIFDELFSGTNPKEAAASAFAFLTYLAKSPNCTFLLTTHFIDVCDKLKTHERIVMNHMQSSIMDQKLIYHYKLKKGISHVQGGINVLINMNYPADIIEQAKLCG